MRWTHAGNKRREPKTGRKRERKGDKIYKRAASEERNADPNDDDDDIHLKRNSERVISQLTSFSSLSRSVEMENADREQHTSAYELETAPFPSRSSSAHTDIDGYGHDIDPELGLSREQHSERRRGSNEDEIQKSGQSEKVSLPGGNDEQDKDETASCETSRRRLCGSRFLRAVRWTLKLLIDQWVLIGIGIVILLAALFPNVGRRGGAIRSVSELGAFRTCVVCLTISLCAPRNIPSNTSLCERSYDLAKTKR